MSNRFQAFCEEGDCLWSSTSRDTRNEALGAFEGHAKDIHGVTDTTKIKFAIDEEERDDDE